MYVVQWTVVQIAGDGESMGRGSVDVGGGSKQLESARRRKIIHQTSDRLLRQRQIFSETTGHRRIVITHDSRGVPPRCRHVGASNQPKPLDAEWAGKPPRRMRRPTGEARPQVRNEHDESEYRRSAGFSAEPGDVQNELAGEIQLAIDVEAEMRKHGRMSSSVKSSSDDSRLERLMSVLHPALPSRHTHSSNWNQPAPSVSSPKPHQRSYKSREKLSSVWRPGLGVWRPKQKFMSSKAATQRYQNPAQARKHHVKRPFTRAATFAASLSGRTKPRWNQINPANPLHDKPRGAKSASVWHLLIPLTPEHTKSSRESGAKSSPEWRPPLRASAEPTFPATRREAAPPHVPSRDRAGSRDLVAADDVSAMVRAGPGRPPVPMLLLLESAGRRMMGRQVRVGRHRAAAAGQRRDVADGDGQDKVDENRAGFLQVRAGRRRRSAEDKTTTAAVAVASGQLRTGRASSRRTRDNDDDDDDDDYDDEKDDVEAADDVDLDRRDSDDDDDDEDEDDEELQALLLSFTYLLSLSLMVRPNIHRVT